MYHIRIKGPYTNRLFPYIVITLPRLRWFYHYTHDFASHREALSFAIKEAGVGGYVMDETWRERNERHGR
jgi:hypothetical protein